VPTTLRFVVVRHFKEGRRSSNTARIAALALPQTTVVTHGLLGGAVDPALFAEPGTVLLFPPEDGAPEAPVHSFQTVVVLDGTWGQARRMSHRVPGLDHLPRLSLPLATHPSCNLRKPHAPWARSTIEAMADVVALVDGPEAAAPLRALNAEFVRLARGQRGERVD